MVFAPMLENYDCNLDNKVKVHTNGSTKVPGAILLQKCTAAKKTLTL